MLCLACLATSGPLGLPIRQYSTEPLGLRPLLIGFSGDQAVAPIVLQSLDLFSIMTQQHYVMLCSTLPVALSPSQARNSAWSASVQPAMIFFFYFP